MRIPARLALSAAVSGSQDQAADGLGVIERELLQDHAPERDTEPVRRPFAGRRQHCQSVVGHESRGVRRVWLIRRAGAAVVERDDLYSWAEGRDVAPPGALDV